jgi:hypothetical protein
MADERAEDLLSQAKNAEIQAEKAQNPKVKASWLTVSPRDTGVWLSRRPRSLTRTSPGFAKDNVDVFLASSCSRRRVDSM